MKNKLVSEPSKYRRGWMGPAADSTYLIEEALIRAALSRKRLHASKGRWSVTVSRQDCQGLLRISRQTCKRQDRISHRQSIFLATSCRYSPHGRLLGVECIDGKSKTNHKHRVIEIVALDYGWVTYEPRGGPRN